MFSTRPVQEPAEDVDNAADATKRNNCSLTRGCRTPEERLARRQDFRWMITNRSKN
jgi:hypothetical protein